ncbi:MAG: prohibitin family protein [Thermodesulfobacteriota bacterium]
MASRPKLENLNFLYPIIIILVIVLATSAFVIVDSGHVGVVRTFGAVQPEPLPEGFHLKKPFMDKVEQVDIRLTKAKSKSAAASKDLQTVETQVTVQYSITGPVAPLTYQRIGQREVVAATVIEPAIQESVKAVTAQYTAEQLVTKRAEVKQQIQKAIENFIDDTLRDKQVPTALQIANVAITDFEFSEEFNKAIELKVKAEQEALQALNEKTRRVTQAEAGYQERKLAADGEAYEIEAASRAKADAIEREAKALKNNPELIQLRLAEKWDGTLPKFTGGEGVPLINIDTVLKGK